LAFDFGNQAQVDIMMVAPVPAFTAVDFCQFNPAVFNAIDGSDVYAIGADNLHMLFYRGLGHSSLLGSGQQARCLAILWN
jgi:hypothetical protein